MLSLAQYEDLAAVAHGHLCAGQILGIRMAMHGLELLGIDDPAGRDRKRLVTYVEIDRCATDALAVVTGCRLGKRALKFRDFGKMAATFCDLSAGRAVRLAARESAKERARAYREMPAGDLFDIQWVRVTVGPQDLPGYKAPKVACAKCGENISFGREVIVNEEAVCRHCAGERYYTPESCSAT